MEGTANPEDLTWLVVIAGVAMAYMAWGIGANDVANAFGPAFGARALTTRQACAIAAVCEATGAVLMGGHVSDTIRKGMMSVKLYEEDEGRVLVMVGMTSVLIGAATWLLVASKFGLPVSTTHSAVGGVIAFAITSKGYDSVKWSKVGMIVASWFISPVMSAVMGGILYSIVDRVILKHPDSMRRAKMAAPVFVFLVSLVVALFTVYKGGKGLGLHKTQPEVAISISIAAALVLAIPTYPFVNWWAAKIEGDLKAQEDCEKGEQPKETGKVEATQPPQLQPDLTEGEDADGADYVKVDSPPKSDSGDSPKSDDPIAKPGAEDEAVMHSPTERLFTGFVVIIAGFFSLAHGANDVANSVGPFGAVLAAFDGPLKKKSDIPIWVFLGAGAMIVVGLATFGIHVMRTIGNKITTMSPSKAFCVNFASTIVVLVATRAGIPVSTTHASVGAVVGVGMAEGIREVDWKVMGKVFLSWVLTLPIVGVTAAGIFALFLPTVVDVPFN
jgi:phosphate/sulfate permease